MGTDQKPTTALPKPAPGTAPAQPNPFKMNGAPAATQTSDPNVEND